MNYAALAGFQLHHKVKDLVLGEETVGCVEPSRTPDWERLISNKMQQEPVNLTEESQFHCLLWRLLNGQADNKSKGWEKAEVESKMVAKKAEEKGSS